MSIQDDVRKIREILAGEDSQVVNIALFGQPGAGKSSLINALAGKRVAEVGVETDKTVEAKLFNINGLNFWDLPGYGTAKFPKEQYLKKFDIKSYDLFLCVVSGKLSQADSEFFFELKSEGKVCIFVVNKSDEMWEEGVTDRDLRIRKEQDIKNHVKDDNVIVVFTSCRKRVGLDVLNEYIKNNLAAAKKERWQRGAKAHSQKHLEEKRQACESYVSIASAASAVNAINPIPGVDVSVDLGLMFTLFASIRHSYGLYDNFLDQLTDSTVQKVSILARQVVQYAVKEGIVVLIKSYAGKELAKRILKYVPLIGQGIAAGIGYVITSNAGMAYLDTCHELAKEILDRDLKER